MLATWLVSPWLNLKLWAAENKTYRAFNASVGRRGQGAPERRVPEGPFESKGASI